MHRLKAKISPSRVFTLCPSAPPLLCPLLHYPLSCLSSRTSGAQDTYHEPEQQKGGRELQEIIDQAMCQKCGKKSDAKKSGAAVLRLFGQAKLSPQAFCQFHQEPQERC